MDSPHDLVPVLGEEDFAGGFRRCGARMGSVEGLVELGPRVFQAALLEPEACAELVREIDRRRARAVERGASLSAANSMHEHGVVLAELGFGPLLDALHTRVAPLAARLLPDFAGAGLDAHHSYLVDYSDETDPDLSFHADDSEVTVNLCLGDEFRGAELVMMGLRCRAHLQTGLRAEEELRIVHEVGHAVIHAGLHRHRVDPIRSGRRRNLILWCRSSALRRDLRSSACPAWCGTRTSDAH